MNEDDQNRETSDNSKIEHCLCSPSLHTSEIVELRPVKTGLNERRSFFRSSVALLATMCVIYGFGLPAIAMTFLWQSLNMANLFVSSAITTHTIFWLFYFAGLGVVAGPLIVLLLANAVLLIGHKASLRFQLSKRGFGWVDNGFTKLAVLLQAGPLGEVPWESLIYISCGLPNKEFVAKHDIAKRFPRYYFYPMPDNICFASIRPAKQNASLDKRQPAVQYVLHRLPLSAFDQEQRRQILRALLQWAPSIPITDEAISILGGSTKAEENPKYTQLWLQLLKSAGAGVTKQEYEPGDRVNSYIIEELMETGGQANIYRASVDHDYLQSSNSLLHDVDQVILKQFILSNANASARLMSLKDFENEFLMLSKLEGANIVKLYDVFVEQQHAFLVLEYIKGGSLRKIVDDSGPLSEELVVQIALDICRALELLHTWAPAIMHRDVSPENIVVEGKIAKLIDFSLAAPAGEDTEQVVGKQTYISPEQFRGQIHPRNDVYALGATMYFALTGDEPEAISQHSPKNRYPSISAEIDGIIRRCTDLDPDLRYSDASELLKELESARSIAATAIL